MMTDLDTAELCAPFVIQGRLFTLRNDSRVGTYDYFDSGSLVVSDQGRFCMLPERPAEYSHYRVKKLSILFSRIR